MALALLVAAALLCALLRHANPRASVLAGSAAQVAALVAAGLEAAARLTGAPAPAAGILAPFPLPGFALDPLGATFVLLLALAGVPIAIYAPGYLEKNHARLSGPWQQVFLCLLEASILGVMSAQSGLALLVSWELMTASATVLVLAAGNRPEVTRAAILYVAMSHVGTLLGIFAVLLLARGAPDWSFAALRASGAALSPGTRTAVLLLGVAGFGTKSGLVPFHVWLPEAHPAAPSHVSALLSGVIVKTAVYVVLRVTLDLAGPVPRWFGFLVLGLGLASALLGVLYALVQQDLKRLLAFSTVENIGIIYLGVGLALVARDAGMPRVAALAFGGALLHAVNHAVFKSLLFLGAGSVQGATHGRNLEDMGGLSKVMPFTAVTFLVGSLAISALPPLSGFASEWTLLQAAIAAGQADSGWLRRSTTLVIPGLALTGAMAAAAFVKAFGIAFLGLPRSEGAAHAQEVGPWRRASQGTLALLCVLMGVLAPQLLTLIQSAGTPVGFAGAAGPEPWLLGGGPVATTSPLAIGLALSTLLVALALATRATRVRARTAMTWACGLEKVEPRMQYTSAAFSKPIRLVFRRLFQPSRELKPLEGEGYFVRRFGTEGSIVALFDRFLYEPLVLVVEGLGRRAAHLASPSLEVGLLLTLLAFCAGIWWCL